MANNNWPFGFRPTMVNLTGGPVGVNEYAKTSSDATAIYAYDLLFRFTSSQVTQGLIIGEPQCRSFNAGTPGTTLILGASLNYGAASTASWHSVIDDPQALFVAQCDGTTSITVASDAGANANVNNQLQTNGTKISAMEVNSSTINTTNTLDLRIRDLVRTPQNSEGPNAVVEVLINKHFYAQGSTGL
jgi:hypothetical protein